MTNETEIIAYSSILGSVLQEAREFKGKKQTEVAGAANMTQSTWARIEVGRACTIENLAKASQALDLKLWQIIKAADERAELLEKTKNYQVLYTSPPDKDDQNGWITNPGKLSTISQGIVPLSLGVMAGVASPAFAAGSILGYLGKKLLSKDDSLGETPEK